MPTKSTDEKKAPEKERGETISHDVEELLVWHAPARVYHRRSKEYYINSALIMLALEVILFLFSQYLLMLVVLSVGFVAFALAVTPPHLMKYRISTEGISIDEHSYLWQELYDFFFKKYDGQDVVIIRTRAYLPGILVLTLGEVEKEHIKQALLPFLPYRENVKPTFTEKAGDFLSHNFPLERQHKRVVHPESSHHAVHHEHHATR